MERSLGKDSKRKVERREYEETEEEMDLRGEQLVTYTWRKEES